MYRETCTFPVPFAFSNIKLQSRTLVKANLFFTTSTTYTVLILRILWSLSLLLSPGMGYEVLRSACLYVCLSVCLSVCLLARMYQKPHVPISPNFLNMLTMAVTRSSSGANAICYVLPVLSVCLSVRLSARISKKLHVQISANFLFVLLVAVARLCLTVARYVMLLFVLYR